MTRLTSKARLLLNNNTKVSHHCHNRVNETLINLMRQNPDLIDGKTS